MALYWYDSFQDYTMGGPSIGNSPWDSNYYGSIVNYSPRTGTKHWYSYTGGGVVGGSLKRFAATRADSFLGMAVNFSTNDGGGPSSGNWQTLCTFNDSTTSDTLQVQLQVGYQGVLRVLRGATVLATSGTTALINTGWHYVEFYASIGSSTGSFTVRVDNAVVSGLQLTNQNTQNTANAYINGFSIGNGISGAVSSGFFYASDLVVYDSTTTAADSIWNTFQGDVRVLWAAANANGGTNQWTNNATAVARSTAYSVNALIVDPNGNIQKCTTAGTTAASAPAYNTSGTTTDGTAVFTYLFANANYNFIKEQIPDDGLTYLSDSNVGDIELYTVATFSGVPAGITSVLAVGVDLRGMKDQTANRGVRALVNASGTQADNGSDFSLLGSGFNSFKGIFAKNPNTSGAWTVSAAQAAKIGVKVSS